MSTNKEYLEEQKKTAEELMAFHMNSYQQTYQAWLLIQRRLVTEKSNA